MKFVPLIVLTLFTNLTFGQSLTNEIDSIYNFQPGKLSDKEKESRMPPLDRFWDKVKSDTTIYLPALRAALNASGHPPFF